MKTTREIFNLAILSVLFLFSSAITFLLALAFARSYIDTGSCPDADRNWIESTIRNGLTEQGINTEHMIFLYKGDKYFPKDDSWSISYRLRPNGPLYYVILDCTGHFYGHETAMPEPLPNHS